MLTSEYRFLSAAVTICLLKKNFAFIFKAWLALLTIFYAVFPEVKLELLPILNYRKFSRQANKCLSSKTEKLSLSLCSVCVFLSIELNKQSSLKFCILLS